MNNFELINNIYSSTNKDLEWIKKHTMFLTIAGSRSYGLHTEDSDWDFRGICSVPSVYLHGFNKNFEQWITAAPSPDTTIFNVKKFFNLNSQGNPNTIELLFTEEQDHLIVTESGKLLLENRDLFLSKQLKERYIGYSKAQAHRIRLHRNWLLNKIDKKPERKDFGLSERPEIEKNQFDVVKALISKKIEEWNPQFEPFSESQKIYLQGKVADILSEMNILSDDKWESAARSIGFNENLIHIIKKEKEFENKVEEWKNFQRWKENRNPKRAALEAKYGFDLKHGLALVRLLRMGKEILETGYVQVKRNYDREELMSIKNGAWTYDQLIEYADKIEKEVKLAYEKSTLPNQPNIKALDNLCIKIVELSLSGKF